MNILSVGYPLFAVGPEASGGAEQILSYLERDLVREGHRSIVIAAAGSDVNGILVTTPASSTPDITDEMRREAQTAHLAAIQSCLRLESIDLIHFHGLDFHTYVPDTSVPMLATLHLPIAWYPESIFTLRGMQLNCVSNTQATGLHLPVVPNGIDVNRFRPESSRDKYLLWIGRVCPEKSVDAALRVAHKLNRRMIVAGPVHPFASHQRYFDECVRPLLDEKRAYIGPVAGHKKQQLLARASCLVVPSLVAETSSLVSMEAISCGTPVVARRAGALPEVVQHGATGFLADSESEMADGVERIGEISGERCRTAALERFDSRTMASRYLELYSTLMKRAAAPVGARSAE